MRHFLSTLEWSRPELEAILASAAKLKASRRRSDELAGRSVALVFFNPSLRTRSSFEIGVYELGGHAVVLEPGKGAWPIEFRDAAVMDADAEEHVEEVARVLSRYCDLIAVRAFPKFQSWAEDRQDQVIESFARYATVPVLNMETITHPCQELALMLTLRERLGTTDAKKFLLTWTYHPKPLNTAVANSALIAAAKFGFDVTLLCPTPEYVLDERYMNAARGFAEANGRRITVTHDVNAAYEGAHVVYAKSWGAIPYFGRWTEEKPIRDAHRHFIVDEEKMARTQGGYFSHCLPLRRNVKATDAVVSSPNSLVIDEAENRLHVQKALMLDLLCEGATVNATQDVIIKLLANIGSRKEVEQYLRHYASVDAPKFAVVKTSGKIIDESLDALASSLTFLQRVGLVPIVVHGGATQIDRALEEAGIQVPRIRGLRPMTPKVLEVARRVLHETNAKLVEALEAMGTRARPFTSGVFEAKAHEDKELGLVGEVTNVRDGALVLAAQAGSLPILTSLGETPRGQSLVIHADAAARALALKLKPHKIVYLTEEGGLLQADGGIRSAVNLAEDYDELTRASSLTPAAAHRLSEIKAMLDQLPPTSSVSITSPENLAKELFTHRGAGTLLRMGERIGKYGSFDEIDRGRLKTLLETCFGRKLHPGYFETKKPDSIYLADSYRAGAIVTLEGGIPYLDKLAVTTEAQGEGIAGSIWKRMLSEYPKIFWRARAQNPVNGWYAQNAGGLYKTPEWWVFWCGMTDFDEIERSVEHALAMPATLKGPLENAPEPGFEDS